MIEILRYAKEIGIHSVGINQPVDQSHGIVYRGFKGFYY